MLQTPAKRKIAMTIKQDTDGDEIFFDTETVTRFDLPEDATTTWTKLPQSFQSFFATLVNGESLVFAVGLGPPRHPILHTNKNKTGDGTKTEPSPPAENINNPPTHYPTINTHPDFLSTFC